VTGPSWSSIDRLEQARWARLVRQHASHDDHCAALRRRLDAGGRLTAPECAELGRMATLKGWALPVAGRGNNAKRGRRYSR
jgi:hypothetical protein